MVRLTKNMFVVDVKTNDGGGVGVYLISKHVLIYLCKHRHDDSNLPEK